MPTPTEGQWVLSYPGCDFLFGTVSTGRYLLSPPAFNFGDVRDGDAELPLEDGVRFGRDYLPPPTITFEVGVDTVDEVARYGANLDALGVFRRAWRGDGLRSTPGAVAALTQRQGGRTRTIYGRPRRWAPAGGQFTKEGYTPVLADFACAEDRWYGDEQSLNLTLVPPTSGGLVAPLVAPLVAVGTSARAGQMTVGGDLPAWPVVTIRGPVTNPAVEFVGVYEATLATTVAYDETVTIDPRPWARTVTRSDGGSLAGALTWASPRLAEMQLPPGATQVAFRGVDDTGTASITVAWRDAWTYL